MENSELIVAAPLLNKVGRVHLINCNGLRHARIDLTYTLEHGASPTLTLRQATGGICTRLGKVRDRHELTFQLGLGFPALTND